MDPPTQEEIDELNQTIRLPRMMMMMMMIRRLPPPPPSMSQ
jgi:hypothetical protein